MNTQRPFTHRRPSQRYDFHRMPVEGSYAMRSNNRRSAVYVALGVLAAIALLMWVY